MSFAADAGANRRPAAAPMTATYRLQIRGETTLNVAADLAGYLARLGVSHLYASPLLQARAGSTHGYDVIDPDAVDASLGGSEGFARMSAALAAAGLRLLLDIVPNHMAADLENRAFADVLAHGPASRFADWFDVEWRVVPSRSHAQLVLPALGEALEEAAHSARLRLELADGALALRYAGKWYPLDPATSAPLLAAAARMLATGAAPAPADAIALRAVADALRAMPKRAATDAASRMRRAAVAAEARTAVATLAERSSQVRAAIESAIEHWSAGDGGLERFARLLDAQAYRLGYWRRALRALNYRRFFNISDLIALRTEDPAVFAAVHRLVLDEVAARRLHALRIDHVDGLLEPAAYLERLRAAVASRIGRRAARTFPILVEKILGAGERLPADWPVEGATGYEFISEVEDVFVEPAGWRAIVRWWADATGLPADFGTVARDEKRRALRELLAPDVARLVGMLRERALGESGGASELGLRRALIETIARLPVYRAYLDREGKALSEEGRRLLGQAIGAVRDEHAAPLAAVEQIAVALGVSVEAGGRSSARGSDANAGCADPGFVARFGQVSGPAAAKGIEDAAFYVHVPLLSRNEVGADPSLAPSHALARLHAANAERARRLPSTMLAATTHDTKRSADARARLDVLSEIPHDWTAALQRWRLWRARTSQASYGLGADAGAAGDTRRKRRSRGAAERSGAREPQAAAVDLNTEYLVYQTLVAIWPAAPVGRARYAPPSRDELGALADRLHAYVEKAVREAGRRTRWLAPDAAFERALHAYVDELLRVDPDRDRFVRDMTAFVARIARPGLWNALARVVVQLASPGVPDVYQGDEMWSFTLVDPDNRRAVDFAARRRALETLDAAYAGAHGVRRRFVSDLVANVEDGRLKLHVVHQGLLARRRDPELFVGADYVVLPARGPAAGHVVAFARRRNRRWAVAAVTRYALGLTGDAFLDPVGTQVWEGTEVEVPPAAAGLTLTSILTGERLGVRRGAHGRQVLEAAELFCAAPVALAVSA